MAGMRDAAEENRLSARTCHVRDLQEPTSGFHMGRQNGSGKQIFIMPLINSVDDRRANTRTVALARWPRRSGAICLLLGLVAALAASLSLDAANAQQPTRIRATIEGSETRTITAESTGAESEMSFVSVVSYETHGDDRYAYLIEPEDDGLSYRVSTRDASMARLTLAVTAIALPPDAVVRRSIHSVEADEDEAIRIPPPPALPSPGIVVVEILGYAPNGDGAYSYRLEIDGEHVTVAHGHGDSGIVTFRMTRIHWPSGLASDVDAGCRSVRATVRGTQRRDSLVDVLAVTIASPTTYWTGGDSSLSYSATRSNTPQRHFNNLSLSDGRSGIVELRLCWIDFRSGIRATDNCRRCEARAVSACQDNGGVEAYWFYSEASGRFSGCSARCGEGMLLGRPPGTASRCYRAPRHIQ